MGDLRALAADLLGCRAVYESSDETEVRCLVELPKSGSKDAQQWLVRLLPRDGLLRKTPIPTPEDDVLADEQSNGCMEQRLDDVLRLWQPLHVTEHHINAVGGEETGVLDVLYRDIPRYTSTQSRDEILHGLFQKKATPCSSNIADLRGIVETDDGRQVAVYDYEPQSLDGLLKINHVLLDDDDAPDASLADLKRRLLVYQVWQISLWLDTHGLTCPNGLQPSQIWLSDGLWARLGTTPTWSSDTAEEEGTGLTLSVEQLTWSSPTDRWVRGDLSNFEYLIMLNAAAGRRMIDGVFHPVLPWVTDFSSRFGGWRDMSKTKFRLNKGDNQLDRTFESSVVPHHITESLSEITYYIYMARRTPMSVLRKVVRSNFQPREYPATMVRLYQWTPDECIPEFYTDASVFESIHGKEVMAEMVLPDWCKDASDFIRSHRMMLESDEVSRVLHQWIDLNFGVCLSGEEAIKNKNVPLKIRQGSGSARKSPGFVQLFDARHPQRLVKADISLTTSWAERTGAADSSSQLEADASMDASLRSAIRIAEDALSDSALPSPTNYAASTQQRQSTPSPPSSSSDRKGLSSSFVMLKKRPKSKQKVQGSADSQPISPPGQRSPTVARFAHAIPKFFGADNSTTPTQHTRAQAALSQSFGPGDTQETNRTLAPQNASTSNSFPPGVPNPSPGTHLFRDLWHQLSKADDDDMGEAADESHSFSDRDWTDADFDSLDETSLLLLRAGPLISMPKHDPEKAAVQLTRSKEEGSVIIDPVYTLPRNWMKMYAKEPVIDAQDSATGDLVFSVGCVIAEIYTSQPLFSAASVEEYTRSYAEATDSTSSPIVQEWRGLCDVKMKLAMAPFDVKNLVLDLIHPDIQHRVSAWRARSTPPGTKASRSHVQSAYSRYLPSDQPLFPSGFGTVYRFLADYHHATTWNDRFRVSQGHLPGLVRLPDSVFPVVLPILTSFFKAQSHVEGINTIQVTAATVYLLNGLSFRLGTLATKRELLDDTLRLYESTKLSPVLKLVLSSPDVLKAIFNAFGSAALVHHFLPVLVDWLSAPPAYQSKKAQSSTSFRSSQPAALFASETVSMLSVSCGELASSDILGPSMAIKYVLPALLPHLGKVLPKWSRLTESTHVIRQEARLSSTIGNRSAFGGHNGDGIHVAYAPKQVLYENHSVADAILLVCRELPTAAVSGTLLPHLCEVVPRIVDIAESVSSAQIDGVPDDLAREVYVTLRVLRHVVRSLNEQAVQRDFLQQRGAILVELINRIQPPFLHPRTADAVMSSMSDTIKSKSSERPMLTRHNSAPTPAATRQSRQIIDRLMLLRGEKAQDLRAFTVVGVARTITSALQKVGADAAATATGILQSINTFLVRCATIYAELEVSDFQWRMASEVVAEFCAPLRALFGPASFAKLFPIVQSSSVLQLLLLPTAPGQGGNERSGAQVSKLILRQASTMAMDDSDDATDDSSVKADDDVQTLATSMPELLHTAYRSARLNGIKTASFLHVSLRSGSTWSQDLNEEIFLVQEERKKRRAVAVANRAGGETAWLRPRWKTPFSARNEDASVIKATQDTVVVDAASTIGNSWPLRGEIRHSMRAHSSMMRSISVDTEEDLVITASKNGSCRVWRLSSYPGQAVGTVHIDSSNVLSACHLEDSRRAIALTPTTVHVWDIRTSQVMVKIPFAEETLNSCTPLRALPYQHYHTFAAQRQSSRGGATRSSEFSVLQGNADFVVSSPRKLFLADVRAAPRVVADWRVDAHDAAWITTTALISTSSNPAGLIAAGTASGQIFLMDKRMGQHVAQWQALESRIVKIVQYSPLFVLIVGSDREARVWHIDSACTVSLRMVVTHVPEGIKDTQVTVQAYADAVLMYAASSAKLLCTRLLHEASPEARSREVLTGRLESWSLLDNMITSNGSANSATSMASSSGDRATTTGASVLTSNSPERGRLHRTKMTVQSVAVLPLRQVVLLGGEDGSVRTCV